MLSSLVIRVVRDALPSNSVCCAGVDGWSKFFFAMGAAYVIRLFYCGAARRGCGLTRCFCFAAHTVNHQAESAFLATTELTVLLVLWSGFLGGFDTKWAIGMQ
jgi:hypothetical protein